MATTEDLRFYDGTSWQSLSALAAKQVEAKLPIESVDGTVVLSDSSGSFVVSTGGKESLKVADGVTSVSNRFLVGTSALQAEMGLLKTDASVWDINQPHVYGVGHAVVETINFKQGTNGGYAGYSMSAFRADGMEQSAFIGVVSKDTTSDPAAFGGDVVITTRNDGGQQNELLRLNNQAAAFDIDIQTPSISGTSDNDASVTLDDSFEVRTGTDTDPKLLIDGNGRFKVQNNGTTNFFVKSDGNVGVNTNGQTYRKVDVGGSLIQSGGQQSSGIVSSLKFDNDDTAAEPTVYGFESAVDTVADKAFYRVAHYAAVKSDGDSAIENHIGFFAQVAGGENAFGFYQAGPNTLNYFEGGALLPAIKGLQASHVRIDLSQQATLTKGDGSEYVVTDAASIATKKYCDDKIWVGTTAQYNALATKNNTTLYCLTD